MVSQYLKAIFSGLSAGLGALATAYAQGNGHIGGQAIIAIVIAAVGAAGVVWGVPNVISRGSHPQR